jgi:hypothetical protein
MRFERALIDQIPAMVRLDHATGRVKWSWRELEPTSGNIVATIVLDASPNRILAELSVTVPDGTPQQHYICVDTTTGALRWMRAANLADSQRADVYSSASLPDGDLIVITSANHYPKRWAFTLARWSSASGETVWERSMGSGEVSFYGGVTVKVAGSGDVFTLFNRSRSERFAWVDTTRWSATDGRPLWHRMVPADGSTPEDLLMLGVTPKGAPYVITTHETMGVRWDLRALVADPLHPFAARSRQETTEARLRNRRASDGEELSTRVLGDITEVVGEFLVTDFMEDGSLVLSSSSSIGPDQPSVVVLEWSSKTLASRGRGGPTRRECAMLRDKPMWTHLVVPGGHLVAAGEDDSASGQVWWIAAW